MKPTDILFRAKRLDNPSEWIEGYFIQMELCDGKGRQSYIKIDGCSPILIDEGTLSMWTTLTDKNGKKIFSNSFVRDSNCGDGYYNALYYIVCWDKDTLSFVFIAIGYPMIRADEFASYTSEVDRFSIDEIDLESLEVFDNPELIK